MEDSTMIALTPNRLSHPNDQVLGARYRRYRDNSVNALYAPGALPEWNNFQSSLQDFKVLVTEASKASVKGNDEEVPPELARNLGIRFHEMMLWLHNLLDDPSKCSVAVRQELGRRAQCELLPYVLLTGTARRFFTKPAGYAGDYWTIGLIYQNQASGHGAIGTLIDQLFLDTPAARAVRNRRGLLAEEIKKTIESCANRPARVTSIACGPAEEVTDVYDSLADASKLRTTLLDIDDQALEFVEERLKRRDLRQFVDTVEENVLYLAIGRRKLELEPQDLVYSIGLIDYFSDRTVIRLIDYIYQILKPGGRLILGNFHPLNPIRALMDHILQWNLIHRTEQEMNRLFRASAFGRDCTNIRFEDEGINLFAECIKS